jgi:signal peptidase I
MESIAMSKAPRRKPAKEGWHLPRSKDEWAAEGMAWLKSIIIVLVIFIPLITFVVQGFRIPSGSMEDTLLIGDFLFADKITYGAKIPFTDSARVPGLRQPQPGDIVIFESPEDGETLIKRCVAVAGQSVEIRNRSLYVDGARRDEPFVKHSPGSRMPHSREYGPVVIPEGHIFCMGDNRDHSRDSRVFGPVPTGNVIAKADILYFSFDTRKMLPRLGRIGKLL